MSMWTGALLAQAPPTPALDQEVFHFTLRAMLSKTLHVSAYAVMTILGGWLFLPVRYRWLMMFFLMAHAGVTEQLQTMFEFHRTGSLLDVLINYLGVAVGAALTWTWWTYQGET